MFQLNVVPSVAMQSYFRKQIKNISLCSSGAKYCFLQQPLLAEQSTIYCLETIFRLPFNLRGPGEFGPWTSAVLIATAAVLERPASSNQNYGWNGRDRVVRQTKANL